MKNVFILCAGRTASTSFYNACSHISNYSCAHESTAQLLGKDKISYPENHIEIDNRLAWFTAQLDNNYGDNSYYVYLTRDKQQIAKSYLERWHLNESIVKAYGHGVLMKPKITKEERFDICLDYVDHVDKTIIYFLENKKNVMVIDVSDLKEKFTHFFNWIEGKGNISCCLEEFSKFSNKNKTNKFKEIIKNIQNKFN